MSWTLRSDGGSSEQYLSLDDVLELLSNYQRRAIISYLRDSSGHVHSITDVVNHLRKVEREQHGTGPGEDHLLSVLVHVHCPKLQELGIAEYDATSMEIRYYPTEKVERMMEVIDSECKDFDEN